MSNIKNPFVIINKEKCSVPKDSRILQNEKNNKSLMNSKLIPPSIEISKSPKASGNPNKSDSKIKNLPKLFPKPAKKGKNKFKR